MHSGVFEGGDRLIALNRPRIEDNAEAITGQQFDQLLSGLNVSRVEDAAGSTRAIQQEIWRAFLVIMILALLVEALLSLPRISAERA